MRSWLVGMLGIVMSLTVGAQPCQLRFAAENDFPPHLIKADRGWRGQSVELLQALADQVGCQLVFENSPWLRSLLQLKDGELDVVSHVYKTPVREQDYYFIGPHHIEAIWLIGRPQDFPDVRTLADTIDLSPKKRIAVLNGAYYGEPFNALRRDPHFAEQLVPISSIQDKLALLTAGRVDAILEDSSVLSFWQQRQSKQAHLYQPLVLVYQAPVYFALSKRSISPELFSKLETAWQTLVINQQVATIQKQYLWHE